MSLVDSAMTREVLRDISKRPLDISDLHVSVMHGVVYLRGRIDKIRGYHSDIDLRDELRVIGHVLRQKSGVREVICEVDLCGLSLAERADGKKKQSYYDHV